MKPIQPNIFDRINSFADYQKKMSDYENHIVKMMIGKEGQPIPCHVMLVSGDKGIGKTYKAQELLSAQTIRKWEIVNTAMSPVQLYKFMWEHNDAIIVLDDVNSIIQDSKDGASLLKACTETTHRRKLSWQKMNANCIPVHRFGLDDNAAISEKMDTIASLDPKLEKRHIEGKTFPDTFFFTGALIILTNKPLSVIDRVTEGAVSNRGWHQEMLFSVDGAVDLLKHFATKLTSFNGMDLTPENVQHAVDFLTSPDSVAYYKTQGKIPTIRTLGKIAIALENGLSLDYDALVNFTEKPAY